MPKILVDGVEYAELASSVSKPSFGVAITSRNRHEVLAETLAAFKRFTPSDVPVVVVDDGSDFQVSVTDPAVSVIRHESALGIPRSKNVCISALMSRGVDHLFLFDDDTRPAADEWWLPYLVSAEPHLQHSWIRDARGRQIPKMNVLYQDSGLVAYAWSMGCMLYLTADVVRRVGGMRPEFGLGMDEHGEFSQRIYNAGLTSFVHQDIPGSDALIWAADRFGAVSRTLSAGDRAALLERNEALRLSLADDSSFVPYGSRNCILTSYFTSVVDVQRGCHLPNDSRVLDPLRSSAAGQDLVLLTDVPGVVFDGFTVCRVESPLSAYEQRWISQWQWLRDNPDVCFVWLVDASDVLLLNDPFPAMRSGVLYCGWEMEVVNCDWIRSHSPNSSKWVEANSGRMLLNCGVVGGDRATVMQLCRDMVDLWVSGDRSDPVEEMTYFNIAASKHPNVVSGIQVTTLFKSGATSHPSAWFAHK